MQNKIVRNVQKGVAYSTVAIVALIGILLVSFWSYNQLATVSYSITYTERTKDDKALSLLELTKRVLSTDLNFASQEAALDVAANGGTINSKTYWYCNGKPTAPALKEFTYALGTYSQQYLNSYVDGIKDSELKDMGIAVSRYGCCGVDEPGKTNCLQSDSSKCESFTSNAFQGGVIEVTDPTYASYSGALSSDITNNRIAFLYYKLKENTDNSQLTRTIVGAVQAECRGPNTLSQKLENAYKLACKSLEFDSYIKCSYDVLCTSTEGQTSCLNTPCDRAQVADSCYQQSLSGDKEYSKPTNEIKAQGGGFAANAQIKFTLTDTKYNIPTSKGLQPLKFNMWAIFNFAENECRPINNNPS